MELPLISIIIPVYNVEAYLDKCIESCLTQSYSNIEIIAVNDGSSDRSAEKLDSYAQKDKRLKVIHQLNSGVVIARNKAINASKGKYLFFVDSDDYIVSNAIEILYHKLIDFPLGIAVGGISYDRGGKYIPLPNSLPYGNSTLGIRKALLTGNLPLSLCSKLIPRHLFSDIQFFSDLKMGEDSYIIIQIMDKVNTVVIAEEALYFYVMRNSSATNRPNEKIISSQLKYMKLVEEYYLNKEERIEWEFMALFSLFMLNQYFQFLRIGGESDADLDLINRINSTYLTNKKAVSLLPKWRLMMLKSYQYSPMLGKAFRLVFIRLRAILR